MSILTQFLIFMRKLIFQINQITYFQKFYLSLSHYLKNIYKTRENNSLVGPGPGISDIQVIYESPNFIIVNKHYDVIINAGGELIGPDSDRITINKQLERLYPDLVNPKLHFGFYFPHRLDFATSGILCIAKNKRACGAVGKAFQYHKCQKFYLALLRGHLHQNFLTCTSRLSPDSRPLFTKLRMSSETMPHYDEKFSKTSTTLCCVVERGIAYGAPCTKVVLMPLSGRRHQLRVHMHEIGHTILGDFTYSDRKDTEPYRMFLHAFRLDLPNSVESFSVETGDPFEEGVEKQWTVLQKVSSVQDAILEFQKYNKTNS